MGTTTTGASSGLRIVAFNTIPDAYRLTAAWVARHGHTMTLLVTTPGPPARRSTTYRETVALAPPEQEIAITTRPRRLVPIIAALAPDLIICASFAYRIPPEATAIPRLGAVNLHPAPLPRYRGPNPLRQIYAGEASLGATLHRIAPEFDAGPILGQVLRPIPEDATVGAVRVLLNEVIAAAFEEGLARAIAGEPGIPQDEEQATYAAAYTEAEYWLDWRESRATLQRRATGLNFFGPTAKATIAGQAYVIGNVTPLPDHGTPDAPGAILDREGQTFTLAVGDGAVVVAVEEAVTQTNQTA